MKVEEVASPSPNEYEYLGLKDGQLRKLLEMMLLCRRFEERVEELYRKGILYGPIHLYNGEEAIAVGSLSALKEEDLMLTHHRCHGHVMVKGIPLREIMSELAAKKDGTCKGIGGSMHLFSLQRGALYTSSIVGSNISISVGVAFALKYRGENDRLVVTFFGDGAVTTGAFAEGLNMAFFLKVPLLLVCENNQYAYSFRISKTLPDSIAERAASFGIQAYSVDGNDVLAVYKCTKLASNYVRSKLLPAFIEARTYRMKPHHTLDEGYYMPKDEVERWRKKDPINTYKNRLINEGIITDSFIEELEEQVKKDIEDSVSYAENSQPLSYEDLYSMMESR